MKLDLGLIIEDTAWRRETFAKKKYISEVITKTLASIPSSSNLLANSGISGDRKYASQDPHVAPARHEDDENSPFRHIKTVEIAVLLTNNDKMQALNKEFRGKNKPTNTLSFPDVEIKPQDLLEFLQSKEYIYAGDIAIGYNILKLEAIEAGIDIKDHFTHLLIHSVLHLIGYDHMKQDEAKEMMDLEVEILKTFNIASPY